MIAFFSLLGKFIIEWILGDLAKKPAPEAEQIKEDNALAEFVEKQKNIDYRLRDDPKLAERMRQQLNDRK